MKHTIFTLLISCLALPVLGQGVQFEHGTWKEVLDKAAREDKLIFVDAFTTWCGPCKWMAANAFVDPAAGTVFNENFINYKFDMEKGEGPDFAQKYGVRSYPTLLFLDAKGKVVHRQSGALPPETFRALGEQMAAQGESLKEMHAKFSSGNYDLNWLYRYLNRLESAQEPTTAALEAWRKRVPEDSLIRPRNWNLFQKIDFPVDSREFRYVMSHVPDFEAVYGENTASERLKFLLDDAFYPALEKEDTASARKVIQVVRSSGMEDAAYEAAFYELEFYALQGLWAPFYAAGERWIGQEWCDAYMQSYICMQLGQYSESETHLKKALKWASALVKKDDGYYAAYVFSWLLYRNGKPQEAIDWAEKSIKLAREQAEDYSEVQKALHIYRGGE